MKKKTILSFGQKKILKPIEYDIHLKYLCPNPSCCFPHWLSFKEASTKRFKVVCHCGKVFSVKRVNGFNIEYEEQVSKKTIDSPNLGSFKIYGDDDTLKSVKADAADIETSQDIKQLAIEHLVGYGFSEKEAITMTNQALSENPNIDNSVTLVKHSLFWCKND